MNERLLLRALRGETEYSAQKPNIFIGRVFLIATDLKRASRFVVTLKVRASNRLLGRWPFLRGIARRLVDLRTQREREKGTTDEKRLNIFQPATVADPSSGEVHAEARHHHEEG